jgi:hypothetical protein
VRGHLDAETVAAFREDLLSGRKAARAAAHLSACPQCAEVDAQLAAVTTVLAAAPAPPMPSSVAARLDAALAAEIAARAGEAAARATSTAARAAGTAGRAAAHAAETASPAAAPGRTSGKARTPGRWFSPLSLRLVAATAAVVLLGGGGYVVSRLVSGGTSGTTANSASAAEPSSSTARRPAMSLAPETGSPALGTAGLPVIASGTHYQPGQERAQVTRVLRRNPGPAGAPGTRHASSAATAATAFPHLAACVTAVTGGGRPRLVDIARYGTRPAAVIVLPVAGSQILRVWIVGPDCAAHGRDVITTFTMPATG